MTPEVRSALAPSGTLRVGLNYGNFLLVLKDAPDGEPRGIAPDLGREIGRRLGVPAEFVRFQQAGPLADGAKAGLWDIGFLGSEPQRAAEEDRGVGAEVHRSTGRRSLDGPRPDRPSRWSR